MSEKTSPGASRNVDVMKSPRARGGYRYLATLAVLVVILVAALILISFSVPGSAYVALAAIVVLAFLVYF